MERIWTVEVFEEDGAVLAHQSLAADLNADIGANDDQRPLKIGALEHLFDGSPFIGDGADQGDLIAEFLQDLLFGELAGSIPPERFQSLLIALAD